MFIAPYRGTDGHIRSVYWTQATPYGEDNLSGTAGTPKAGGDPRGYYLAQTDVHQVAYRGEDGHIHEIYWVGDAPAQGWSPSIACNAPKAAGNPYPFYVATINTKHLVYRGEDKRIYDLSWNPGGQVTVTDLTEFALAPAAKTDPRAFVTPKGECHVFFVGEDDHVHEIRFGEQFFVLDTSRLGVLRDLGVLIGR